MRRELASRFRGSLLGPAWAVLSPLLMLMTYVGLFSVAVPQLHEGMTIMDYAAGVFIGLIIYNLFAELANRGPMLLHEHVDFVKKSIFPSETFAWVATIRAFVYGGIAFGVYLVFRFATAGGVPLTALFAPLLLIPFALFLLGLVWFLMALGAFTRDVAHIMPTVTTMVMFASPIFFRLEQAPPQVVGWLRLNPIGQYVEMLRGVALEGSLPEADAYVGLVAFSYAAFIFGYTFFQRYKSVIVDVI